MTSRTVAEDKSGNFKIMNVKIFGGGIKKSQLLKLEISTLYSGGGGARL